MGKRKIQKTDLNADKKFSCSDYSIDKSDYINICHLHNSDYLSNKSFLDNTIYIDTETTGLGDFDQILEISIIGNHSETLFHSLINPGKSISKEAIKIHKITDEDVKYSPTMEMVEENISAIIKDKIIVIYNAMFDLKKLPISVLKNMQTVFCCMLEYARVNGEWNHRYNNYKWIRLEDAAEKIGYEWKGEKHRASSDALACRGVWHYVCSIKI